MPADTVLITDEKGMIKDMVPNADAGDNIQYQPGLITPGFINCHCHLELSHMKGMIPQQTGLVDFLLQVVNSRHINEEDILAAIEKAEAEMMRKGIVAVGDICNTTFSIGQKSKGNLLYHNFIESSGFPVDIAGARFSKSVDLYHAFADCLSHNSIVPHAPYSVSGALLQLIVNHPGDQVLTMHNQESAAENELFFDGSGDLLKLYENLQITISSFRPTGKTSLQSVLPYFDINRPLILVHNVHTSEADIQFQKSLADLSKHKIVYCFCPNANLYISNKLPDIDLFIQQDCQLVLGTDSLASNSQLSIWEEIKTISQFYPEIALTDLLQWATINGARALGIADQLGSFEKGKQPGVLLIADDIPVRII